MNRNLGQVDVRRSCIRLIALARGVRFVVFASILLLLLTSGSAIAQHCFNPSKALLSFDTAIEGASLDSSLLITSTRTGLLHVTVRLSDSNYFRLLSARTFTVDSFGSAVIRIRFAPDSTKGFSTYLVITTDSACDDSVLVTGTSIVPTFNPVKTIVLGSTSKTPITVTSSKRTEIDTLIFLNGSGTSTTITGVGLADSSTTLLLENIGSLPRTLASKESDTAVLTFSARSVGEQERNQLIIATNNPIGTEEYPIYAVQFPAERGVGSADKAPTLAISLYPNPTRGELTILVTGLKQGRAEVFDVLGRMVGSSAITSRWLWQPSPSRITSDGNYIVRITGKDPSGRDIVASKRFVVLR